MDLVESSSKGWSSGGVVETDAGVGEGLADEGTLIDAIQWSKEGSPPKGGLAACSPSIFSMGLLNSDASDAEAIDISPSSPGASQESSGADACVDTDSSWADVKAVKNAPGESGAADVKLNEEDAVARRRSRNDGGAGELGGPGAVST